jgi:hypothetical protein
MSTPKTPPNGTIKDPTEWTTGDEPMTGAQDSYLHTLARTAGEEVERDLTKAEASIKIGELRTKTGVAYAGPKRKTLKKGTGFVVLCTINRGVLLDIYRENSLVKRQRRGRDVPPQSPSYL